MGQNYKINKYLGIDESMGLEVFCKVILFKVADCHKFIIFLSTKWY